MTLLKYHRPEPDGRRSKAGVVFTPTSSSGRSTRSQASNHRDGLVTVCAASQQDLEEAPRRVVQANRLSTLKPSPP